MVLDSMHVHNFHCQMVNGVKMLSDDATITAAENILLILPPQKKKLFKSALQWK